MTIEVNDLIAILEDSHSRDEQEQAAEHLISAGASAVEALTKTIISNQGRQSWLAAKALAHIDDSRVVPTLISALDMVNMNLQGMIIGLLGNLRDQRSVLPIIETLNEKNTMLQLASIQALKEIGDTRAVKHLLIVLENTESPIVRYTSIETLADLGDTQVIEPIRYHKDDENHHVRQRVERALEKLNKRAAD